MKRLNVILALVGISILFSCVSNVSYPEAMDNAIRCMEEYPDSAQIYLSSLNAAIQHEPEETQIYYGLLTTKAKDKQFIPHTSDSLMTEVVRFYESNGNQEKLMEAYYYLGSVYRDMKDAPQAITAFQQAADAGKNSQQYDILERIYSQMGTLLAYQSLYEDAMKAYKISYTYNLKRESTSGLVYALRNQGRMHESLNRLDSAEYYYQAAYEKAIETKEQELINSISVEFGYVYLDLGKPDSAIKVFSRIPELKDDAIYLQGRGYLYLLISQPDSAEFYFLKALQEGIQKQNIYLISFAYKTLAQIEAQKGNYQVAFNYAQNSLNLEDTIKKRTRTEVIGKTHALYNYQHTEDENQLLLLENEHKRNHIYLLIIGLLVIVGAAILYTNYARKQKRIAQEQAKRLSMLKNEQYKNSQAYIQENEKKLEELEALLQQAEGEKDELHQNLTLLQSQKALLEVSNKQIEMSLNEKEYLELSLKRSEIYQLFHQAVHQNEKYKSITEDSWKELQEIIDKTYSKFTEQLYIFYPQISEHELHICYLIKIQIQIKDIAKLLCRTAPAITNSRIRLYKKIHGEEGKAEMLDSFILDL